MPDSSSSNRIGFRVFFGVLGIALLAPVAAPAKALSPRDELLRLVPDDAVFCLIVQDLRGHLDRLLGSPLANALRRSPMGQAVLSAPETQKLLAFAESLRTKLNVDWERLRNDIVGDAVVFTYWPGPMGQPDQEQGLVLIRARDAKLLAELVDRFRDAESAQGIVAREATFQGKKYMAWSGPNHALYVYRHGAVLAASRGEPVIQRVIARDGATPFTDVPAVSQRLSKLGIQQPLVTFWVNARAFIPEIQRQAKLLPGPQATVLSSFLSYYRSILGVVLYATPNARDVELGFRGLIDPAQLPEAARKLLAQKTPASDVWRFFPENALAAGAGRLDPVAFIDIVNSFLPDDVRKAIRDAIDRSSGAAFDKDWAGKVLPFVGPDWGFCILPPRAGAEAWIPSALWALRLQAGPNKEHPIDRSALQAMDLVSTFLVLSYNSNHPESEKLAVRTSIGDGEIRYFANDQFPSGFQPAYALREGYLVVSTSLDAVRGFHTDTPALQPDAAGILMLRVSFRRIKAYLTDHADKLIPHFAAQHQLPVEEESKRYHAVLNALELLDRLELWQRSAPNQLAWTIRIRPTLTLQK